MLHAIKPEQHGPHGAAMAQAVQTCVHCGFCLPACPTYRVFGQEMDTPRGRIVLMKQVLEGQMHWNEAQLHIDRCLGCLACEPACPSGVVYRDLITPFRALAANRVRKTAGERLRHWLAMRTLPFPARLRRAAKLGGAVRRLGRLVPSALAPMLNLLPARLPAAQSWPSVTPAQGESRARVALLLGCAQQVLEPDINTATIDVLSRNGVEVIVPRTQGCCGGLAWHTGELEASRDFARRNLAAFPSDVDAIVTNAAGCGTTLHEYATILQGTPHEAQAASLARKVRDVSAFLGELGPRPFPTTASCKIAYHDACHLANGQNVRHEPRELLRAIPGVELCELADAHLCCGSAGTYNLDQPDTASLLGEKRARAVIASGADVVATGNIGCLVQLRTHLARLGSPITVRHTIQVLRDAYAGASWSE